MNGRIACSYSIAKSCFVVAGSRDLFRNFQPLHSNVVKAFFFPLDLPSFAFQIYSDLSMFKGVKEEMEKD